MNRAYEPLHNSLSTLSISKGHHLLPSAYRQPSVRYSIRYDSTSATESKKPDSISTSRPSDASSNGLSKASMAKVTKVAEKDHKDHNNSHIVQKKPAEAPKQPILTIAWAKIKHEANHYWDGTKLLASEIKISARLLRRTLQGKALTRRERRQVRRCLLHVILTH